MNDIKTIPLTAKPVVFSDLDGTLLDHDDYNYDPALVSLQKLQTHQIPIVFCTSKTFDETFILRQQLNIRDPFIIENGAAICIPDGYFPSSLLQHHAIHARKNDMLIYAFSEPRAHWQKLLDITSKQLHHQDNWQSFTQLGISGIAAATGLNEKQAALANQREFGEPILWGGSEQDKADFINTLSALGAKPLQGGRFLHISGNCDKGTALIWLSSMFKKHYGSDVHTIAAGDSANDIAMLEAADTAIIVRSPSHAPPTISRNDNIYISEQFGPAGWSEALEQLILI